MTSAQEAAVTECKNASSHAAKANHTQDVAVSMLCGAVAGAVAKTAVAPVERVKMSSQISSNAFTLSRAFRHGQEIVRSSGVKSLWRGHSTTLIRVIPLAGITFATHDCLEAEFKEYLSTDRLPIVYKFLAGAIAGASGTFITYPLDVMRVRLALTPGTNWGQTLRRGGFYQGLGPTMLGIVPYSGTPWMMKQTMLERFIAVRKKAPSIIESLIINALAG